MKLAATPILALLLWLPNALSETYECTVTNGVYAYPGALQLDDALERDKSLAGAKFVVSRTTGTILGSALFSNEGDEKEVIRNVNDVIDVFIVQSKSEKDDITVLRIKEFEGQYTFTFYSEFFGLFLVGECKIL